MCTARWTNSLALGRHMDSLGPNTFIAYLGYLHSAGSTDSLAGTRWRQRVETPRSGLAPDRGGNV